MIPSVRRVVTASPDPLADVPDTDGPAVSFVMVTYGTGPIVIDSLSSLVRSMDASGPSPAEPRLPYEVIVVDHPHPDRADRRIGSTRTNLLLCTSGVILLDPGRNLGFGGGCELGALHASAPVLAFVNPDTVFTAGWLEPLLEVLRSGEEPMIIAPTLLNPDGSVQEVGQTLFSNGHTAPNVAPLGDSPLAVVDYASAACWLVRRDDHERVGGFDPAYHPAYFEDVDLALRFRRQGGRTVVHQQVAVTHHRGEGTPGAPRSATDQRHTLLATWPGIAWRQHARPAANAR